MRGGAPNCSGADEPRDSLKSSLKKGSKSKKHRVVFDESANEFFEADYIIVVRDECAHSDAEGEQECEAEGCAEGGGGGALSPPDGYKDMGLFNSDGTLREQAWWEAGDVLLVGERGTVFTPRHLQLLRRLQQERMLRASSLCGDCDALHHHNHQHHIDLEFNLGEQDGEEDVLFNERDGERGPDEGRDLIPMARRTGKHISAGEERPKTTTAQQTTPTDQDIPSNCSEQNENDGVPLLFTSDSSECGEADDRHSSDDSPLRGRRGGILKGGRLWRTSLDHDDQSEEQRSATASDEEGSSAPRTVRFLDKTKDQTYIEPPKHSSPTETERQSNYDDKIQCHTSVSESLESPPCSLSSKSSPSAVNQLFNRGNTTCEPQGITSDSLRAWDNGGRQRNEEAAVRRVAERNALRCSLLRSEARKKNNPKPQQESTSLAERIRLLTCDVEEEAAEEADGDKVSSTLERVAAGIDRANEKAFGSGSSTSSSTSTISIPTRHQPPDLGDSHQELHKKSEGRRQFLSSLAPLTACVGSAAHEGYYYAPAQNSGVTAAAPEPMHRCDPPAPDIVAGTPGACDSDEGLAAFARASAHRTDKLRQKYIQEPLSSDDEHDDYGFHRRPAVRGIAVRQQLGTADDLLEQMQNELQPSASAPAAAAPQTSLRSTGSTTSWTGPYYSDNSRPQSRASSITSNWSKSEYVSVAPRMCSTPQMQMQGANETCYSHSPYSHYQRNDSYSSCANALYANVSEALSTATSCDTSPVRGSVRGRRPESPPPIRPHHRVVYVPYAPSPHFHHHRHYQHDHSSTSSLASTVAAESSQNTPSWTNSDYAHMQGHHQQATGSINQPVPQPRSQFTHPLHAQTMCGAPARYRTVPAMQPGGGTTMICYSEKVAAPLYQPAPSSPSRGRGAMKSSSSIASASPVAPPNPLYYAMNV